MPLPPTAFRRRPRQARTRAWMAAGLALVLLCWQMSIAAYACPLMIGGPVAAAPDATLSQPSLPAMPCMDMMGDDDAPGDLVSGLCQQHCQFGATSQVADPAKLVFPLAIAWPSYLAAALLPDARSQPPAPAPSALAASLRPPPPHSLLHCCFRI